MSGSKLYIPVLTAFNADGRMVPLAIRWTDGRRFNIDRVIDVRRAPALKAGGCGDRYTVRIEDHERFLFFERSTDADDICPGKWFVETENSALPAENG